MTSSLPSARPARGGNRWRRWRRGCWRCWRGRRRRGGRRCRRRGRGRQAGGGGNGGVVVVVLWLMRVVGRSSVDGWLSARLCTRVSGCAVRGPGEQGHEADRNDRADLGGPPGQPGEAAKPCVPRGIPGMAGPDRVAGVRIEVCPALAPEWRRACRISRLGRNRISRLGNNEMNRLVGKGGVALVKVGGQPIGGAALHGAAVRRMAVGVVGVSILCGPVSRAEPGSAGEFRRPRAVLTRARAGPARRRALRTHQGNGRLVRRVMTLAVACPVWTAGLPGPVVCWLFVAVTHMRSTAQPLLKPPEGGFNELLRCERHIIRRGEYAQPGLPSLRGRLVAYLVYGVVDHLDRPPCRDRASRPITGGRPCLARCPAGLAGRRRSASPHRERRRR